jgi:hypothetical protein
MKTYNIKENYGRQYRITVEDDTQVQSNVFDRNGGEGAHVRFTKRDPRGYDDCVIAAFTSVRHMYEEGLEIEVKEPDQYISTATDTHPSQWTSISSVS